MFAGHVDEIQLVITDIDMPRMDGIEATRQVVKGPGAPPRVLVLTTFDLDDVVYDALRAGASGFLLKDAPEERLTTAIRVVAEPAERGLAEREGRGRRGMDTPRQRLCRHVHHASNRR